LLVERRGGRRVRAGIGLDLEMWRSFWEGCFRRRLGCI
jgi:hypothetical protein